MTGARAEAARVGGQPGPRHSSVVAVVGVLYAVVAVAGFAVARGPVAEHWPLKHDQVGYYAYLPALIGPETLDFRTLEHPRWRTFVEGGFTGFRTSPVTGRGVNPFTPGVAVAELPFALLGHLTALATGAERDGYSAPYRVWAALGGVSYATAGLLLLLAAIGRRFGARVAVVTVLVLGLGTNLLYYATVEPLMTHAYSFFALAALVRAMLEWERSPSIRHALAAGAALGLAIAIRPTNAVALCLPVGYLAVGPRAGDRPPWRILLRHGLAAGCLALLMVLPLLAYWRYATGSWITNPIGPGAFYFDEPRIGGVLWSYRKGWFVYTPVMLTALPGLVLLRERIPRLALPLGVYAALHVYVAASYWSWWYGGSFGMRALIEMSAPLALAVAAFVAWGVRSHGRARVTYTLLGLLVALNLFQTYQYVQGYIHWDGMTRETYWSVFLRPSISGEEMERIRAGLDERGSRGMRTR